MFTATYTNPQGITHSAAVFLVVDANMNENISSNNKYDFNTNTYTTSDNANSSISLRAVYWANQASYDNGDIPFPLLKDPIEGDSWLYGDVSDSSYTGLSAVQKAELFLQNDLGLTNVA